MIESGQIFFSNKYMEERSKMVDSPLDGQTYLKS